MKTQFNLLLATLFAGCALQATSAQASGFTTLHTFASGADGAEPMAGLAFYNGDYYGVTMYGGTSGFGTVFELDPATGAETVLYSFAGGNDGMMPWGGLIVHNGILYGTTSLGGNSGKGALFSFDPSSGTEQILHHFGSQTDGVTPYARLTYANGALFGITTAGGAHGGGTVYSFNLSSGSETILHSFSNGSDGATPVTTLTYHSGKLYGSTISGGTFTYGTLFEIQVRTHAAKTLYNYVSPGDSSYSGLIYLNGLLYGTMEFGGDMGSGSIFSFDLTSNSLATVYSFQGTDGSMPLGDLIYAGGSLYGTTYDGGNAPIGGGYGVVYKFDLSTGRETVVHDFAGASDGQSPEGGLTFRNGTLYGSTISGGATDDGTLFSITH